jgi:16S rRNA (cytidine1402-2'-O)-methyltransferase
LILYAVPTPLGGPAQQALPVSALETVRSLRDFAVENAKSARAFLSQAGMPVPVRELRIEEIGERSAASLLQPLREGRALGLLSEAGCPAIADPGAALVEAAHREGFRVVPLVGPSSIIMALMASGLEGQRFAFNGYLPQRSPEREQAIRQLEERSARLVQTEIFIEAPYRNNALLAALLGTCKPSTRLCLATEITAPGETIRTQAVADWSRQPPNLDRRPTVFLFLAGRTSAQGRGRGGGSH